MKSPSQKRRPQSGRGQERPNEPAEPPTKKQRSAILSQRPTGKRKEQKETQKGEEPSKPSSSSSKPDPGGSSGEPYPYGYWTCKGEPSTDRPVALILFSGRPREGDLQDCLAELGWTVCAVDILAPRPTNVLDDGVWSSIVRDISLGMFEALWVATPCNTFSPLREKQPGPRVLRSVDRIQGLKDLSPFEQKQVKESNIMTSRSGEACTKMDEISRPWGLENPDHGDGKPSLWKMPAIVQLAKNTNPTEVKFDQCRTGLATVKPTKFFVKGMDLSKLDGLRCNHPVLEFTTTSGEKWHAAHRPVVQRWVHLPDGRKERASKSQGEYTRELCLTIAQAMHGAVDKSWLKDALSKDPLP